MQSGKPGLCSAFQFTETINKVQLRSGTENDLIETASRMTESNQNYSGEINAQKPSDR